MPFPSGICSTTLRNREKKTAELDDAHARVSVHQLGIFNRVLGEHWPNRDLATPKSPLRAIKLWKYSTGRAALVGRLCQEAGGDRDSR